MRGAESQNYLQHPSPRPLSTATFPSLIVCLYLLDSMVDLKDLTVLDYSSCKIPNIAIIDEYLALASITAGPSRVINMSMLQHVCVFPLFPLPKRRRATHR